MAFIDSKGRKLTKEEVTAVLEKVKDTIQKQSSNFYGFNSDLDVEASELAILFGTVYGRRLNSIDQDYMDMFNSEEEINLEETLKNEFSSLNNKALNVYGKTEDEYSEVDKVFKEDVVEPLNEGINVNTFMPKMPVAEEIVADPDAEEALKWYTSFGKMLEEKGLDIEDFHDSYKVRVLQDVSAERKALMDFNMEDEKNLADPKCVHDYLRKANVPAFLFANASSDPNRPEDKNVIELPKPVAGELFSEHPLNYIEQNRASMKIGLSLNDFVEGHVNKIKELYNMARNGRINLYTGGEPESEHTHAITVDENGLAHYEEMSLAEMKTAYENNQDLSPLQRKIGSIVKEYDEANARIKEISEEQRLVNKDAPATEDSYKKIFDHIHKNINFDVEPYKAPLTDVAEADIPLRNYTGPKPRYVSKYYLDKTYLEQTYEIPEGLSAEACSMIVYGSIISDENLETFTTFSSAGEAGAIQFKRSNFLANVLGTVNHRFAQYSSAFREGRKNAIEAINEIKEHPEKAVKFVDIALKETIESLKKNGSHYTGTETLPLFTTARELYKTISEEPFKSGIILSNADKEVLEYGKKQADLLDPYIVAKNKGLPENPTEEEKIGEITRDVVMGHMAAARDNAKRLLKPLSQEKTYPIIMQKAREENWDPQFLECKNYDEVYKLADKIEVANEEEDPIYLTEVLNTRLSVHEEEWQKSFTEIGINQWIKDTPPEEARRMLEEVITNTRYFRGKKAGNTFPKGKIEEQIRGISPYARYDVRNVLLDNIMVIEPASRPGLDGEKTFTDMIDAMKEMVQYIGEHPQNNLDQESVSAYREKLAKLNKAVNDYANLATHWDAASEEYKIASKSIKNVEAVKDYINQELQSFDKNLDEYKIHKEWDFDKEIKWYKSFSKVLAENGVDVNNPVSLLSVRIMGDFSKEAKSLEEFVAPEYNIVADEDQKNGIKKFVTHGYVPAYLAKDGKADAKMPDNPGDSEPADFYFNNSVLVDADKLPATGEGISAATQFKIKELYEAAKAGRLFIDHTSDKNEAHPVMIDENGEAKVSARSVTEIAGAEEPATEFEKTVKANVQNYNTVASTMDRVKRQMYTRERKFIDNILELDQKTTIMMKDYQNNPGKYSTVEKALKSADDLGASWNLKAPTSEVTNNLFSPERETRIKDYNNFAGLAKEVLNADTNVSFGSKKYEDFLNATIELVGISLRLAKQKDQGTVEQANEYRNALLDVKKKAEEYIEYKGDVKDQKGIRRVNAAKAIVQYAEIKYKGVLGTVLNETLMTDAQKKSVDNTIKAAEQEIVRQEQEIARQEQVNAAKAAAEEAAEKAANAPKPDNYEITDEPDEQEAIKWYRSLGTVLKEKGLDTTNFRDISKVRVLQGIQTERKALLDYDTKNAGDIANPKCVHDYLGKAFVPAFLMTDGTNVISLPKPEPGKLVYEHPVNYIDQNAVKPDFVKIDVDQSLYSLYIVKIKELYNMARNGRLNLYTGGEPEMEHTHALTVDENGLAHYEEKSFSEISKAYKDKENLTPVQRKIGYIVAEYDEANKKLNEIAETQKSKNPEAPVTADAYKKVFTDIHENINVDVTKYTEPLEGVAEADIPLRNYTGPKPRFVNEYLLDRTYLSEVYEIPEGISPEACSMIVFGAIIADENMSTFMHAETKMSDAEVLAFNKSNFISNIVDHQDYRFAEYSSAIKAGRKNGVQAINEIKEHPEKAMSFLQNAVKELVFQLKESGSYEGGSNTLETFVVSREMFKVIGEEPFKSGLNISAEDKAVLEYGKIQADLYDPLLKHKGKSLTNDKIPDQEKPDVIAAQELIKYMASVRKDARYDKHYAEDAKEETFAIIMEKAREEDWGEEEYRDKFLNCKNFDELLEVANDYDAVYGAGYGDEIGETQDRIAKEGWGKDFLNTGINQWLEDTPADEARQRMMDVLTNTRHFKGLKAGVEKPVGEIKEQMAGIAPFERYNVRNVLTQNIVAIENASRLGLNDNAQYNTMINAMKDMLVYIGTHPQNDLDRESVNEYTEKMTAVKTAVHNYAEYVDTLSPEDAGYNDAQKSIENVKTVGNFIDKEITDLSKNIEEYRIHKEWDFDKEMKWYKSFSKMLADNGVDVTNPVSLLSVRIMGDLSKEANVLDSVSKLDSGFAYVPSSENGEEALAFNKFISQGYVPAYLAKDGQNGVKMPGNPRDAEPADFYFKNTMLMDADKMPENGEGISAETQFKIKELYEAAKAGRLFIDHTGELKDAHPVMIDDKGEAKLSDKHAKELAGMEAPASDFEKKVQANVKNYSKVADTRKKLSASCGEKIQKFYEGTVELKQKTTLMMKDYQTNPGNYQKVEDALKRSDVIGASWNLKAPTSDLIYNMFSENAAGRVREHNKLADLSKAVLVADNKVYFGSQKYKDLLNATIKLTKLSQRLALQTETGSIEQANEYRQALLEVKQKADAYIEYKGEVKDKKGVQRVEAAKAIAEYAEIKYKGVLGSVLNDTQLSDKQKEEIDKSIKEAHLEAERREKAAVESAEKLYDAFLVRLERIGDQKSMATLVTMSEPDNHKDFVELAMKTNVVKSMVDDPNLFGEKGQRLVTDVLKEMSSINKNDAKKEQAKEAEKAKEANKEAEKNKKAGPNVPQGPMGPQ